MTSERGATLVEMIATIAILGAISAALAASVIVGLKTTGGTMDRLEGSHEALMVTAFFSKDVQGAEEVALDAADCTGATALVRMERTDGGTVEAVSYAVATSGGTRRLVRRVCADATLQSEAPIVRDLPSDPAVTCEPTAACPGRPARVTISLADATGYVYRLATNRRAP